MANRVELPIVVLNDKEPYNPVSGAPCVIFKRGTASEATVFTDSGATNNTATQPLSTDSAGRLSGWVARGAYDIQITIPGRTPYVEPFDASPAKDGDIDTAWLAEGAVTGAKVAAAIKDAATGTASLRTLGTGAAQATAGNDSRLSDERTPKANSVETAKIKDGAVTTDKTAKTTREVLGLNGGGETRQGKFFKTGADNSSELGFVQFGDDVLSIVLSESGLIFLTYEALIRNNGGASAEYEAAIFLNGIQLKAEDGTTLAAKSEIINNLGTKVVRSQVPTVAGAKAPGLEWTPQTTLTQAATGYSAGQVITIEAAAGTYDVGVRFKPGGVKLEAEKRKLRVWTRTFG